MDFSVTMSLGIKGDEGAAGAVLGIEVLAPGTPWPLERILRRFGGISDEDARELAAGYPFRPPVVEAAIPLQEDHGEYGVIS